MFYVSELHRKGQPAQPFHLGSIIDVEISVMLHYPRRSPVVIFIHVCRRRMLGAAAQQSTFPAIAKLFGQK